MGADHARLTRTGPTSARRRSAWHAGLAGRPWGRDDRTSRTEHGGAALDWSLAAIRIQPRVVNRSPEVRFEREGDLVAEDATQANSELRHQNAVGRTLGTESERSGVGHDFGMVRIRADSSSIGAVPASNTRTFAVGRAAGGTATASSASAKIDTAQPAAPRQSEPVPAAAPIKKTAGGGKTVILSPEHQLYRLSAGTLAGVVTEIESRGTDEAGETTWAPTYDCTYDAAGNVATVTVTVPLSMTMPWWPAVEKQSQSVQKEWSRFYDALARHEDGHVRIVNQALGGLAESMVGTPRENVSTVFDAAVQRLQQRSDAYDASTDHGRKVGTALDPSVK